MESKVASHALKTCPLINGIKRKPMEKYRVLTHMVTPMF